MAATWFTPTIVAPGASSPALERGVAPEAPPQLPSPTPRHLRLLLSPLGGAGARGAPLPGGRRLQFSPTGGALRLLLLCLVLLAGWTALRAAGGAAKPAATERVAAAEVARLSGEGATEPGGVVFDLVALVVVSTVAGGFASHLLDMTPLIGITWVAFAWANCTGTAGELTAGVTPFVRLLISRIGLMVILVRAGLSLDLPSARSDALRVAALAALPLLAEATVHAAVSRAVLGGPWAWCFLRGFLGAAIAPSVVVPGVLKAKAAAWGAADSPANAMLAAVTIESAAAVWAISFLIDLAIPAAAGGGRSTALTAALGPIQLVGGVLLGCATGAIVVGAARLLLVERDARTAPPPLPGYNTPHKRVTLTVATLLAAVCLTLIFLGSFVDLAGGGSLAAVSTAALASGLWARGSAPEREVLSAVKLRFGGWWDAVVLPALFCMLGSSIDAQAVFAAAFLADYAPGLVAGVATRFLAAFACAAAVPSLAAATAGGASEDAQPRRRWSVAEAVWCAASCIGKASVQAALGGAALVVALDHQADARAAAIAAGNVTAAQLGALTEASGNVERAQGVASLASLAAVVFAPISAALMRALGPPLLGSAKPAEVDKR